MISTSIHQRLLPVWRQAQPMVSFEVTEIALHALADNINAVLLGKHHQVMLAFSCLLADVHLLVEDRPGMGTSTLAEALARSFLSAGVQTGEFLK